MLLKILYNNLRQQSFNKSSIPEGYHVQIFL